MVISTITSPRNQSKGSCRPVPAGTTTGGRASVVGGGATASGGALKRTSRKTRIPSNGARDHVLVTSTVWLADGHSTQRKLRQFPPMIARRQARADPSDGFNVAARRRPRASRRAPHVATRVQRSPAPLAARGLYLAARPPHLSGRRTVAERAATTHAARPPRWVRAHDAKASNHAQRVICGREIAGMQRRDSHGMSSKLLKRRAPGTPSPWRRSPARAGGGAGERPLAVALSQGRRDRARGSEGPSDQHLAGRTRGPAQAQNMCRRIAMLARRPSDRSMLSIDEPP